ncbi:MAG: hypothetical protein ACRET2_10630, partial [Steroidobacteraceae bacterium]
GSHTNPAVEGNGLTAEDFAEDPDFHDDYMSGVYDVECHECGGARVIAVAAIEQFSPEQVALWEAHEQDRRECGRDYDSERWLRYAETGVMG